MDTKDLDKLFKVCRKHGVTDFSFEGMTVKFGDLPSKQKGSASGTDEEVETDEPSEDELIYYAVNSAGPL